MRHVWPVLLTLVINATAARAQTNWAEKLFPEGTTHSFGSIPHGSQLYYRFKMYNVYAVPLDISYRIGCSCVTVTPSTRTLQPLKEEYLDVYMDARRFKGLKSVNIYFSVGPEYISSATLQVSANGRADVVLNPGQISFGVVSSSRPPAPQAIDVEYAGVLDWRVTEIITHNAPLDVKFNELYRRPRQVGYRMTVALKPDAPAGALKHEVFLRTNDPSSPLVPVLVEATIQASLSVVPSTVALGTVKVGDSVAKKVIVRGHKPFRIVAVEGAGDGVEAQAGATEAAVQVVQIKFQPTKPGEVKRQLRIKTSLEQDAAVSVSVEGTVEP